MGRMNMKDIFSDDTILWFITLFLLLFWDTGAKGQQIRED